MFNLRNQVEQAVRDAILRGAFKPGERLVESMIASQLGVSRAPVRIVLSALEREGLVVNYPRRGNFVIDFTEKDIDEIYSLRIILENGALRRAMTRMTDAGINKMQNLVNQLGHAYLTKADPLVIVSLDLSFHEFIYDLADHSRMRALWNTIRMQTQLLIGLTSKTHAHPGQAMKLHQQILDALRERDLSTAEARLTAHIQDGQKRALQSLQHSQAGRVLLNGLIPAESDLVLDPAPLEP